MGKVKKECNIVPIYDNVLVEVVVGERVSSGGIVLPDPYLGRLDIGSEEGVVLGIGPSCFGSFDPFFKVGDRVLFVRYAGRERKEENKIYRIMKDIDIIARLES